MISQSAEYALRAVTWLAGHPDRNLSTAQIAAGTQVPPGYLSKMLQVLARAGIVTSTPGRAGGFRLARPAEELTVLTVVNAIDPVQRIRECPLKLAAHAVHLCPLHRRLDDAAASVEAAFAATSIAELVENPARPTPLCPAASPPVND